MIELILRRREQRLNYHALRILNPKPEKIPDYLSIMSARYGVSKKDILKNAEKFFGISTKEYFNNSVAELETYAEVLNFSINLKIAMKTPKFVGVAWVKHPPERMAKNKVLSIYGAKISEYFKKGIKP
jgi:hypothetical protein